MSGMASGVGMGRVITVGRGEFPQTAGIQGPDGRKPEFPEIPNGSGFCSGLDGETPQTQTTLEGRLEPRIVPKPLILLSVLRESGVQSWCARRGSNPQPSASEGPT